MRRKGFFQPLLLAAVLAAGFGVAWGVAALWAVEVGAYVVLAPPPGEQLGFRADGTARIAVHAGPSGEREFRDLQGNLVPEPEDDAEFLATSVLPAALPEGTPTGEVPWEARVRAFADGRVPATFWYFIGDGRPAGTGYFVGYDSKSRALVGYLGTAGFREGPPPADELIPFAGVTSGPRSRVLSTQPDHNPTEHPGHLSGARAPHGSLSPWDVYVLGRGGKLYHADLRTRTVELALDEPGLRSAAVVSGTHDPARGTPSHLAARVRDAVLVLDERGRVLRRYPLPEVVRDRGVTFGECTTGEAVAYWSSPDDDYGAEVRHRIFWVAPAGTTREAAVTLPRRGGLLLLRVLAGAALPTPVGQAGLFGVFLPRQQQESGAAATYGEALGRSLEMGWPTLLFAQALAAGLALLCYRRQVRYAATGAERWLWPLFVLVVGWPGWIGYRFGRSWPVLERCPACRTGVPRDRDACARCEEEFPRPALKGTEVFA
jgi:hypothetical protein